MSHQIFQNGKGSRLDVDISPIHPAVCGAKSSTKQPIACLGHALSSAGLCSKAVSTLDILVDLLAKILFNDRNLAKRHSVFLARLKAGQKIGEKSQSVVLGITNEKGQIDEVVRICQVAQMREKHGQMRRRISKWGTKEDSLLTLPASCSTLDVGKVVITNCFKLQLLTSRKEAQRDGG